MSVRDLAAKAGISKDTVTSFENGRDVKMSTVAKIQTALEAAGVSFLPDVGEGVGLRLKPDGDSEH